MTADRHDMRPTDRPADGSAEHLSGVLRRTVADFEVRIEEAALRADAFRLNGKVADAALAEDEQHQLVEALEHRLQQQVADALVMREAQRIVAASELDAVPVGDEVRSAEPPPTRRMGSLSRSLAGALAVAVAAGLLTISNGTVGNLDVTAVRDAIVSVGRSVFPARQGPALADGADDETAAAGDQLAPTAPTSAATTVGPAPAPATSTTTARGADQGGDLVDGLLVDLGDVVEQGTELVSGLASELPTIAADDASDSETETETESDDADGRRNPFAPDESASESPSDGESDETLQPDEEPTPGETPGTEPTAPEDDPDILGDDESVLETPSLG